MRGDSKARLISQEIAGPFFVSGAGKMKTENEKFQEWARGNNDAAIFLATIFKVSQDADDIADGDGLDILGVVSGLLMATTVNRFFVAHREMLSSLLFSSLITWAASNKFGKSENQTTRMFGFVCREALEQIIPVVSMFCGATVGEAVAVAEDVHRYYHQELPQDTFAEWESEVNHG